MGDTPRDGASLLSAYLKDHGLSAKAFAEGAKVPSTTVTRALRCERAMDIYSAANVETATRGKVPASSWALVKIIRRRSGARATKSAA